MKSVNSKKPLKKKEKQPVARKKTSASPLKKASDKPSVKAKKAIKPKKTGKPGPVAKKPAAGKIPAKKKPQQKADTTQNRLLLIKKTLLKKKETILKEVKEEILKNIGGDNKQLVDTAIDDGDWALVDISEDVNLRRLAAHRELMHDIDEAVIKIANGTYGICEECDEEISSKRLAVLPTATLCIDCQEKKEQLKAFEGE